VRRLDAALPSRAPSAPSPARVVLYQKNIEAYAADAAADEGRSAEEILREEIRLTVLHELGHFFGMEEDQLEDV
jgi:predicted Zn-dependent protease with MMP-like domain